MRLVVLMQLIFIYAVNSQVVLPSFQGFQKAHTFSSGNTVSGFSGQVGPVFVGWTQCEGYLDQIGGDDIPQAWGDDCTDNSYTKLRLVCGENTTSYRYIDVDKNVFREGLTGYPESGLISASKDQDGNNFSISDVIYATGNHPHNSRSWWAGPWGCQEYRTSITVNNNCTMECANCFGQNLGNNARYLWIYVQ